MNGSDFSEKAYENLVREGIQAARSGRRSTARRLLMRAATQRPTDARVWLWLTSTTDSAEEQRGFLERAVAADPSNPAAIKGLSLLNLKRGEAVEGLPRQALADTYTGDKTRPADPERAARAVTREYECPQCGGRMHFQVGSDRLVCDYCGHAEARGASGQAGIPEGLLSADLISGRAQAWPASLQEIACTSCGAHTLSRTGVHSRQCPYCGANQFVEAVPDEAHQLPQEIVLFRIEQGEALQRAKTWLSRGFFAPDDLLAGARSLELRPAYYPVWSFDGGVEIRWTAEVRESYADTSVQGAEWRLARGQALEFFDDVLVSGLKALSEDEISLLEPFNLKDVVAFNPDLIAGWATLVYDRSLADASLLAREQVLQRQRPRLRAQIEPGREKRNVQIGAGSWSGVTYKLLLLPIWVGSYHYGDHVYRVLVNGQTGKVGGRKPEDRLKVFGLRAIFVLLAVFFVIALAWLLGALDLFG